MYEPDMAASGFTWFEQNGFILGREAFSSKSELGQTIIHELHRLSTTGSKSLGLSGSMATSETASAANFAKEALEHLIW